MFNSVTWKEFLALLSVLLLMYYAGVAYLYYKKEILQLLGITMIEQGVFPTASLKQHNDSIKKKTDSDYLPNESNNALLQLLTDELHAYSGALTSASVKEEVMFGLLSILNKYPSMHHHQYRTRINNQLLSATKHNGISYLDEDELEVLWKKVS
jgi:hypothetical protein